MPPRSLTDLAGLRVSPEDFLAAVLEMAAQPIWVVDREGVFRFANPAAIAALGYDSANELLGRPRHDTIHYRHPDGTPYPAAECPMLLPRAVGQTVTCDLDWFVRRDGSMFPVSYASVPIEMPEGRGALVAFTDIEDRVRAEEALRERDAVLRAREDSLRRIAALVAGGAASGDVFAAIAREVGHVVGLPLVVVLRYAADRATATVIGAWSEDPHPFQTGTCLPLDASTIGAQVLKTGRPARIDFDDVAGTIAAAGRKSGLRAAAGAPIIVDGDVWGAMTAGAVGAAMPDHVEDRLAEFTELVATAISNTESRAGLARMAEEQAALRRVATLVARGTSPDELFAAVVAEVERVFPAKGVGLARYDADATITTVAISSRMADDFALGARLPLGGRNVSTVVSETGRSARIDSYGDATGSVGVAVRDRAVSSVVGAPIVVEGRLWGVMLLASTEQPLPADSESRLASFTELVATAIANAEARTEVAASRARIVVAADEERRRVVRDLHDGAQQRLIHTVVTLKLAQRAVHDEDEDAPALLTEALDNAEQATAELRELAHGILPTVLTQGGLRAGLQALTSRMPVPVDLDVTVGRLAAAVEATAYFVVAEALTNVAKHARARRAEVTVRTERDTLVVHVRDDGVGGAQPDGSGLLGLADRLAALDGRLRVDSPADSGTLVAADIPIPD